MSAPHQRTKTKGDPAVDFARACGKKTPYETPLTATKAAYGLEAQKAYIDKIDMRFEVYRCRYCHYYHIGREKDRSWFDYRYKGAVLFKHPVDVWRAR